MIKEKTSYLALDPKKEEKDWATGSARQDGKTVEYTLPDGQKLKVRPSAAPTRFKQLTLTHRLALSASELPRFFSILRSLVSSTRESTRLSSMLSAGLIWI